MNLDMHFHSNLSDWKQSIDEIVLKAKDLWLQYAFLTDHDRISSQFVTKARGLWIKTWESVEISTLNKQDDFSLHLTYYAWEISQKVSLILENTINQRIDLIKKQIDFFRKIWFEININDFYKYCLSLWRKKDSINKYDLTVFLFLSPKNRKLATKINGWKITMLDFYMKYLKKWWEKFSEYWVLIPDYEPTLEQIKDLWKADNAIISIAHPNFTFKKWISEFKEKLPHYVKTWWINAIEINSKATTDWVEAILEAKDEFWLFLTFWSDNHWIWKTDNKHWDFWELNPILNGEFVTKELKRYINNIT